MKRYRAAATRRVASPSFGEMPIWAWGAGWQSVTGVTAVPLAITAQRASRGAMTARLCWDVGGRPFPSKVMGYATAEPNRKRGPDAARGAESGPWLGGCWARAVATEERTRRAEKMD